MGKNTTNTIMKKMIEKLTVEGFVSRKEFDQP